MKKILMLVVALFALVVSFTGCAKNRTAVEEEKNAESIEVQSTKQEADKLSNEIINDEDWEDWSTAQKLTAKVLETRETTAFQYEPNGVYNLKDRTYKTYTFDFPNNFYEVVMMDEEETFPFIIHNTGNHGVSFQSIVFKDGKFMGLTANYVLFETEDGTVKAVSIKEKEEHKNGEYRFEVFDFNNLSKEEQETAIYPNGSYQASF